MMIDRAVLRRANLCRAGVKMFCEDFGIDFALIWYGAGMHYDDAKKIFESKPGDRRWLQIKRALGVEE